MRQRLRTIRAREIQIFLEDGMEQNLQIPRGEVVIASDRISLPIQLAGSANLAIIAQG